MRQDTNRVNGVQVAPDLGRINEGGSMETGKTVYYNGHRYRLEGYNGNKAVISFLALLSGKDGVTERRKIEVPKSQVKAKNQE